ncbi:MAG: CDP-alcohol phosphatidyltransferase family protein [Acidimicrobiales bacterium]
MAFLLSAELTERPPGRGDRIGAVESRAATDDLLAGLRARGWSPPSWGRFALAAGRRSVRQAVAHPRAAVEVTVMHAALARLAWPRRAWVGISWAMAVSHLGMLGPRRSIGAASALTLLRANLPVVANLPAIEGSRPWLGVAAILSDKADGILARRAGPTQFGHYADSLADAAFWAWFAWRNETDRRFLAAAGLAWVAPVAAVTVASFAKGEMVEVPRPALLRPAAAMQAVLALRALREPKRSRRSATRLMVAGRP